MSRQRYIQHLRSKDTVTTEQYGLDKVMPKLPEADNVMDGEIVINYADDNETIIIKNEDNEIVKFLNEKVIYENEEITAAAMSQMQNAFNEKIQNLNDAIEEIESESGTVQSDWNVTNESSPAYIKNKPTIPVVEQSDWNVTNSSSPAYIKNKPTIPTIVDENFVVTLTQNESVYVSDKSFDDIQEAWGNKTIILKDLSSDINRQYSVANINLNPIGHVDESRYITTTNNPDQEYILNGTYIVNNTTYYKWTLGDTQDPTLAVYTPTMTPPVESVVYILENNEMIDPGYSVASYRIETSGNIYADIIFTCADDNGGIHYYKVTQNDVWSYGYVSATDLSDYYTKEQVDDKTSGVRTVAGTGLSKTLNTINHSNSVTANTDNTFKTFKFDSEGHITAATNAQEIELIPYTSPQTFSDDFLSRLKYDYTTGQSVAVVPTVKDYIPWARVESDVTPDPGPIRP